MLRVIQGKIHRGHARRVVAHRHDFAQVQRLHHGEQVTELLPETVAGVRRLLGSAETQKVKGHNPAPARDEVGNQF